MSTIKSVTVVSPQIRQNSFLRTKITLISLVTQMPKRRARRSGGISTDSIVASSYPTDDHIELDGHCLLRMEQTRVFNNSAIQILEAGYLDEAKDMFRAALETKLAHDRSELEGCNGGEGSTVQRCVTPECVFLAEYHLSNRSSYISKPKRSPGSLSTLSRGGFTVCSGTSSPQTLGPSPTVHLFSKAFAMEDADFEDVQYASAINVFNLGLVHQLEDRSCTKARTFYEVAASLLALDSWDEHSALLRAAVTNNFAVWAYQNGQFFVSRAAFMELGRMVASWPGDPEHAAGFQSNLGLLEFLQDVQEHDDVDYPDSEDESDQED